MHPIIAQHRQAIEQLAHRYGVTRRGVFGSVCTPEFDEARSDIDFLVTHADGYDYGPWLGCLQDLQQEVTGQLARRVDVVMPHPPRRPHFAAEAAKTRTVIYGAGGVVAHPGSFEPTGTRSGRDLVRPSISPAIRSIELRSGRLAG